MLEPFFNPEGIAVIGASRNPHKLGNGVIHNLVNCHYKGKIYPVNRTAAEILGLRCYSSVSEIPEAADLAIVIVPAPAVCSAIEECGKRGIGHAIVISGGFSETGEEGRKLETELQETAARYGIRFIGPNCIGTIDTHTPVNTTFVKGMPETGEIGFCSQSGAMVASVMDWARGAGVGFSRIASLGNQVDVNETEMIEALLQDRQSRVITAYIEGVSDGARFLETAREASVKKPFVALKGGRGESGARAVASHTGALAGSAEAYEAAFRRCGVLQADTMEEMFDWARALAWQPLPKGKRVAVLTNAGGPAILAVDALEKAGLELAELSEKTISHLRSRLPAAASVRNPVDVLAGSGPGTYALALDTLLSDETVDSVVVIQAPQDWFLPASLAEVVGEVAGVHHKPVIASIMGKASVDEALAILHKRKIPNVSFPERTASILAAMIRRREWLNKIQLPSEQFDGSLRSKSKNFAFEKNWKALLEVYGIRFPEQQIANSLQKAHTIAADIGYPVAMKLQSASGIHKTDIGGVLLGLTHKEAITAAWQQLQSTSKEAGLPWQGVLIQSMVTDGQELILGMHRDPQFGPLVIFGTGGTEVELHRDVATAIAPLNRRQAGELIDATRAGLKMKGWRSRPPADRDCVIEYLMRLSRLAEEYPEIEELEINPLCIMPEGEGAWALDVRASLNKEFTYRKEAVN